MKKFASFLGLFFVMLFSICSYGQHPISIPNPVSTDFVNNNGASFWYTATKTPTIVTTKTDTVNIAVTPGPDNYQFQSLTFQWDMTAVGSGTPGGKIYTWKSADGGLLYAKVDSFSLAAAAVAQCYIYTFTGDPGTNYRMTAAFTSTFTPTYNYTFLQR